MDSGDTDICKTVTLDGVIVMLTKGPLRSGDILRAAHVSLLLAEAPIVRRGLECTEVEGHMFRGWHLIEVGVEPAISRGGVVAGVGVEVIHGIL